jgi:hypothetical protein
MRQSMRLPMRSLAGGVTTAVWLLSVPAANAQAQFPSPGPSEQRPSFAQRPSFPDEKSIPDQNSIPDQKLDAAAAALEQVANVREDYQQRIEAAAPSDRQGIADEAKNALVKAITNHGLSVEEYTSILVVAQNDPVVREKIVQRIRSSPK